MIPRLLCLILPVLLLGEPWATQGPKNQDEALALLASMDGTATFGAGMSKRVIGIDI